VRFSLPVFRRAGRSVAMSRLLMFLAVMGPGIITQNVDNDAGGITTYSLAGAQFGYALLWTMIPITIALYVIQEMAARMGAVTGKGLADLIRERFGVRTTLLVMITLLLADFGNTLAEFSGLAAGGEIFGIPKYIFVPMGAVVVWILVVKGTYRFVELVFLGASAFYICYIVSGTLAHPNWGAVMRATVIPTFSFKADYIIMFVGVIGTTIAPWMQFYLQSTVVEKGITTKEYGYTRTDVLVGSLMTDVVAWFIIIACGATIFAHHIPIQTAKDAAVALRPLAGVYAAALFALGLINASLFSASVLPLATAHYVCESLGFESGINRTPRQAPVFYGLYVALIVGAVAIVLIPGAPLLKIMFLSQVANGVLLPFILLYMLLLINNKKLMGLYTNSRAFNMIAWITVAVMIVLTLALVVTQLFPA
jgi:Mn2+/Fe2+ NRAMP family transporter